MKKIKFITILLTIVLSSLSFGQSSSAKDRGYVIWDFDLGYDFGDFNMASIDGGSYKSVIIGSRFGFNFSRMFIGIEGRWGFPSYTSEFKDPTSDNLNNPLPNDSSTSWGPSIAFKFNAIELHYAFLSDSYKFEGTNDLNGTSRDIYYRHEGNGHRVGVGIKMFDNVFLIYSFRTSKFDDFIQRIDGEQTENTKRTIPMTIRSHYVGIRIPIDLTAIPRLVRDSFLK